jgi:hypothetical protein
VEGEVETRNGLVYLRARKVVMAERAEGLE